MKKPSVFTLTPGGGVTRGQATMFRNVLFLIFFLFPAALFAQASVNVNNLDPVYRDIDKLVAFGLVDKIIMGQRPFSRREFARITGTALGRFPTLKAKLEDPDLSEKKKEQLRRRIDYLQPILSRLQARFEEELIQQGFLPGKSRWYSAHPLEQAVFDFNANNSPPRMIPPNGTGLIQAVINPLLQYQQGRHIVDGTNLSLETESWVRASKHFAVLARPRFQLGIGRDGQADDNNVYVQNLYAKFYVANFEVEVGRDQIFYGQGYNAGLLLSNNPRGLDMIKISNDSPGILPGFLRYLGAHKLSFFYADLGPEQFFPHSYLIAFKWNLQPLSFLELGVSNLVVSGGEGSPQGSFGDRVLELFPFGALFGEDIPEIGNKMPALDIRFRIPPARYLELYAEAAFDDINGIAKVQYVDDAAYIAGFYLPRLLDSGAADLRMEYHRTGIRFYRHGQFLTGNTENQFILGDILGPNAQGVYMVMNWDINADNLLTFNGAFEDRSNDIYRPEGNEITGESLHYVKIQDLPNEKRYRGIVGWQSRISEIPMLLTTRLGIERVQNFKFIAGNDRTNFLGEILFQVFFDRQTRFPRSYQ